MRSMHMPSDPEKKIVMKVGDFVYTRGAKKDAPAEIAHVEYLPRPEQVS